MNILTIDVLKKLMPRCIAPELWIIPLSESMFRFGINSKVRVAAFLAQIAHESSQLNWLVENLNYSSKRLMQVWPNRFTDIKKAEAYEKNPQKLANYIYAKRLGNGDEASGDGWKYRGRGLIQLTGRGNYQAASSAIGIDLLSQPELLEKPKAAALSAAYFWKSHGLNELADDQNNDNDDEDFITITMRINGGKAGLNERKTYWKTAKILLG
jgi:putative chitinase